MLPFWAGVRIIRLNICGVYVGDPLLSGNHHSVKPAPLSVVVNRRLTQSMGLRMYPRCLRRSHYKYQHHAEIYQRFPIPQLHRESRAGILQMFKLRASLNLSHCLHS